MELRRLWIESVRIASSSVQAMHLGERLIYMLIGLIIVITLILAGIAPDFLEDYYLIEDGILEWLMVAILLFCAILCFGRAVRLRSVRPRLFLLSVVFIGLTFIFGAGEELSWGQRIFMIETPEWLKEHNKQEEINVHNLMVGDISVNWLVFGRILALSLALYLLLLPWMADRSPRVNGLVERLGLPLPTLVQALAFLPALSLPELVPSKEADELREVCGGLMIVILFCYPKNGYIYSLDWRVGEEKTD